MGKRYVSEGKCLPSSLGQTMVHPLCAQEHSQTASSPDGIDFEELHESVLECLGQCISLGYKLDKLLLEDIHLFLTTSYTPRRIGIPGTLAFKLVAARRYYSVQGPWAP
jgi:hypothetical protein